MTTSVGLSCCDPAADAVLKEQFEALNVPASDPACATIVKAILCQVSKGANLHRRPIFFFSIYLSFFFVQPTSKVSPDPLARYLPGAYLWMLLISFNLYLPSCVQRCIPSTTFPKPGNSGSIGSIPPRCTTRPPPSTASSAQPQQQDAGICLERLAGAGGTTAYLGMAAHPDSSGRAFLYTQDGKVSLASLPARGPERRCRSTATGHPRSYRSGAQADGACGPPGVRGQRTLVCLLHLR